MPNETAAQRLETRRARDRPAKGPQTFPAEFHVRHLGIRQPRPRASTRSAACEALALELGPLRVNAVSPSWVDTPVWDQIASPEVKQARLAGMAAQLSEVRIGHPEDIANAVSCLMSDNLVTGTVLHAEGAQQLV